MLTVSDLEEDVLYQFTLRALTSAGEGKGKTTSAKTKEDSECLFKDTMCTIILDKNLH